MNKNVIIKLCTFIFFIEFKFNRNVPNVPMVIPFYTFWVFLDNINSRFIIETEPLINHSSSALSFKTWISAMC